MCGLRLKRIIAAVLFVMVPMLVTAQTARILEFENTQVDLGDIKEVDGVINLPIQYTNISDKQVVILDVYSQCDACLTAEYSKSPIGPGESRTMDVTFNPKGKFGSFKMSLTVTASNGDYKKYNTLVFKGNVISVIPDVEIKYPHQLSPMIRAKSTAVGMRQMKPGEEKTKVFSIVNASDEPVELSYLSTNSNLKIKGPEKLAAGESAEIEYTLKSGLMPAGEFEIESKIFVNGEAVVVEVKGLIL